MHRDPWHHVLNDRESHVKRILTRNRRGLESLPREAMLGIDNVAIQQTVRLAFPLTTFGQPIPGATKLWQWWGFYCARLACVVRSQEFRAGASHILALGDICVCHEESTLFDDALVLLRFAVVVLHYRHGFEHVTDITRVLTAVHPVRVLRQQVCGTRSAIFAMCGSCTEFGARRTLKRVTIFTFITVTGLSVPDKTVQAFGVASCAHKSLGIQVDADVTL